MESPLVSLKKSSMQYIGLRLMAIDERYQIKNKDGKWFIERPNLIVCVTLSELASKIHNFEVIRIILTLFAELFW